MLAKSQTRRPYSREDYRYLAAHYKNSTGPEVAQHLGRTIGSLKSFLQDHPELKKRPKT